MVSDIVLAVLAAFSQFVTAYLGWRVTVDGAKPERKKLYETLFVLGGLFGFAAIGTAAYRSNGIARDLETIKTAQQKQNAGLAKIEKNTEQPFKVEVNVPPAKQKALMALSKTTDDDGIVIFQDSIYPQLGWLVNVSCKNIGAVIAKRVMCPAFAATIPANQGLPTNKAMEAYWQKFTDALAAAHPSESSVDLEPGRNMWNTLRLFMLDVDPALNSGDKVIMVGGAISYRDDADSHKKEFCEWAQPPFNPNSITWHFCGIGHNRELY